MPFLAAPIAAALTIESALGIAAIQVALSVGTALAASVAIGALTPKPQSNAEDGSSSGSMLDVKYGGSLPRQANLGKGATGGHLVYINTLDDTTLDSRPNETLQAVFVIGDGTHGHITNIWYNGKHITLPASPSTIEGTYYAVPEFTDAHSFSWVWLRYYNGDYNQLADSQLVAKANPAGRWTSAHRGRGVAYLIVHQIYNEELDLTGIPELLIETEGLLLYDPRKDSTIGGSGSHVWGNISTYEPSNNPVVQEYNFRRGITIGGQRVLGMTVASANLLTTSYFAAANVCDEAVALDAGGTEPRYRCSINVSDDRPPSDAIAAMNAAHAGQSLELGGQFGVIAGAGQAVQTDLEFTDDDLIAGEKASFSKWRSRSDIVTAVAGRFSDPGQKWQPVSFPTRTNATDDSIMGERLAKEIDLTQVFSSSQAERLAEIERRRTLQLGSGTVTLPIRWIAATPGDWIRYNSARHGDMTIRVNAVSILPTMLVQIAYEKIASSVYSWGIIDESDQPGIGLTPSSPASVNQLSGVIATGVSVPGDNGLIIPAIRFEWIPIFDDTVIAARFEVRVAASPTQVLTFDFSFVAGGLGIATAGIQAATIYQYRYRVLTFPERITEFSAWFTVTSGSLQSVLQTQTVINGGITADALAAGAVTTAAIADAAITAQKIHDQAVTATKFAAGIEPVSVVSTLPTPAGYTGPRTVFLTTDKKLYRYDPAVPAWTKAVDGVDIVADSITAGQIAAGAIGTSELAAGAVTAGTIAAGAISADKLAVGNSNNVIPNADFSANPTAVDFASSPTASSFGRVVATDPHSPPGIRSVFMSWSGSPSGNGQIRFKRQLIDGSQVLFSAIPGQRYEFSAYIAVVNCTGYVTLNLCDASGNVLSQATGNTISSNATGALANWPRSSGFFTIPAGTSQIFMHVQAILSGGSNPTIYCAGPYLGTANPNQTALSDFSPTGVTIVDGGSIITSSIIAGKLTTDSVVASNIQALAITTGKLASGSIYANDLFVNNVIVRGAIQSDTSTRIDAVQGSSITINYDTGAYVLCSMVVNSIGGNYLIDFSADFDWDFGFEGSGGSATIQGTDYLLFIKLWIDGSEHRVFRVNAPADAVQTVGGNIVTVRWGLRGNFRGIYQVSLGAGNHTLVLYGQSNISKPGYATAANTATIVAFEARR